MATGIRGRQGFEDRSWDGRAFLGTCLPAIGNWVRFNNEPGTANLL
jgi:hypothetical protein